MATRTDAANTFTLCAHLQITVTHAIDIWLQGVKNVLSQAYADATQVTDELVDCILQPGLQVSMFQASDLSRMLTSCLTA